jgi:hypothetical protein
MTKSFIEEQREVAEWRDGVIVEFYAYKMHLNEGGSEAWDNELSVIQRGIVLGDEVVGCDYELSKEDFIDGVYIDGIDAGGGYHVDDYLKAVLVEPAWFTERITQIITNVGEELLRRAEGEKQQVANIINTVRAGAYNQAIDTLKQHIANVTGVDPKNTNATTR